MPKVTVNGVTLAYELFGQGPPVVWTPAGWFPRNEYSYLLAGRLSANYRVLLWDRRNTGESDIGIEDAPSDMHLMADDLHHLLAALDMSPAYLAGRCYGHVLSLLMAYRYPEDVKALILSNTPGDDPELGDPIVNAYLDKPAAAAEESGMQAVIDLSTAAWMRGVSGSSQPGSWDVLLKGWAETVLMNPGNHDRLLAMDPKVFAATLRKWRDWYMNTPLSSNDWISTIAHPALVLHGFDPIHPRQAAEALYQQLPNAEWVEYTDRWSQEEFDRVREEGPATQKVALLLPFIEAFLQRIESEP